MDTTSPEPPNTADADRASLVADLAGLDPADVPGPAAELAHELTLELEALQSVSDPEQLRAAFDDDTGSE